MTISNKQKTVLHVAKAQLGLTDDEYRAALCAHAGVESSASPKMTDAGFLRVMKHFERFGFRTRNPQRHRNYSDPKKLSRERQVLTARIWATCHDIGKPNSYADGIAKRMFKVDRVEWCTPAQIHKIVAALAYAQKKKSGAIHR